MRNFFLNIKSNMILTLDVGNTAVHVGWFYNNKLIKDFHCLTSTLRDNFSFINQLFSINNLPSYCSEKKITAIGIASVVPSLDKLLLESIKKKFNINPFFLKISNQKIIKTKIENPESIGSDRLAGCIGALNIFPNKNLLVVDLGTATVFDVVMLDGTYLSGAIFTGVKTCMLSLTEHAEQISNINIKKPSLRIGNDTKSNLQIGYYYGHLGALKEIKSVITSSLKTSKGINDIFTIGTGGDADMFHNENIFDVIVPDLVLYGIKESLINGK